MAKLRKKNIIFDFDGTIADTIPVMRTIAQNIANEGSFGLKLDEDTWEWVRGHHLLELPKKFGVPMYKVPGLILKGREQLKKQIFTVPLCNGIRVLMDTLKNEGITYSILSSSKRDMIQQFLLKQEIASYFTFVHSELNLFGKDKALIKLMRQHDFKPDETVYVGDEVRDYEACAKINLDCISVTWGLNSRKALEGAGSTYVVDTTQELLELII